MALLAQVLTVAVLHLLAAPARAEPSEDAALVYLERGIAAFRRGDYAQAQRDLTEAQRLAPHKPNPYRWLALVEVQLGDCPSALPHIAEFIARVAADDPRVPELARQRELCARDGTLSVASTPSQATLRIDGRAVGLTPHRALAMRAGDHRVAIEKAGFEAATRSVVVTAGQQTELHLVLQRQARPITARWWFWPAVVGASVAVTGVAIYALRSSPGPALPTVRCDVNGCRPTEGS